MAIPVGKDSPAGSPAGGGKLHASGPGGHFSPGFAVAAPELFLGCTTHPAGTGSPPGLQRPSFSNPNSEFSADRGIALIAFEELFWTPMSASSEPSYGPCVLSSATWTPASVTVIKNWQLPSLYTGGHCGKAASAPDGASKTLASAAHSAAKTTIRRKDMIPPRRLVVAAFARAGRR